MKNLQNSLYFVNNTYYSVKNYKCMEVSFMPIGLKYQLSIFGNYSISPSPEMITTLMTQINRISLPEVFLPNMINSQQIEIPSNRVRTTSNLGFVTQDQKYIIAILNDRIDINYNKTTAELSLNEFYAMAEKILCAIMQSCNLTSNRLAANIQMLLEFESLNHVQELGKDLLKSAEYYGDKLFCEWSTRVNAQSSIKIGDTDEGINVITDISSAQSIQGEKAAIIYHMDINTLPQNMSMRFGDLSLEPFVAGILPIAEKITNDVERLILGDQ